MGKVLKFPKLVHLKGRMQTREVWLNGKPLDIKPSQKIRDHSEEFCWGYGGSGPAQLALAIMLTVYPANEAERIYQHFKRDVIAGLPECDFDTKVDIDGWREKLEAEMETA